MTKVSVLMSTYNENQRDLCESIDSVLTQTYGDFEFIIVLDNPDNQQAKEIVCAYGARDKRIVIIENEKNLGLTKSLNKAIGKATGEYIMRMDADDISVSERMKIQVDYLDEHPECELVSGNFAEIDESSCLTGFTTEFSFDDDAIPKIMKQGTVVVHPAVMVRRQTLLELNGYREIASAEDYDLWLRMISKGYKIHIIEEPVLLRYRIRRNSITRLNYAKTFYASSYVRRLFIQRCKNEGNDGFSIDDFNNYLFVVKRMNSRKNAFEKFYKNLGLGSFQAKLFCLVTVVTHPYLLEVVIRSIKFKYLMGYSKKHREGIGE